VLLSVKPGRIGTASRQIDAIPDHGDLLAATWRVEDLQLDADGKLVGEMATTGRAASYRFWRRICMPGDSAVVELQYAFRNESDEALPCYWCAHPLLAVGPDARIEIEGHMKLRVDDRETRQNSDIEFEQRSARLIAKRWRVNRSLALVLPQMESVVHSPAKYLFVHRHRVQQGYCSMTVRG